MAKADDLKALVERLLKLKESAVTPTDSWAETLGDDGATEAKINGLRVWFYDSTLPPEATAPLKPTPSLGIEVREGQRMDLVFRIHVEAHQMASGALKADKWKRGFWEQALALAVAA